MVLDYFRFRVRIAISKIMTNDARIRLLYCSSGFLSFPRAHDRWQKFESMMFAPYFQLLDRWMTTVNHASCFILSLKTPFQGQCPLAVDEYCSSTFRPFPSSWVYPLVDDRNMDWDGIWVEAKWIFPHPSDDPRASDDGISAWWSIHGEIPWKDRVSTCQRLEQNWTWLRLHQAAKAASGSDVGDVRSARQSTGEVVLFLGDSHIKRWFNDVYCLEGLVFGHVKYVKLCKVATFPEFQGTCSGKPHISLVVNIPFFSVILCSNKAIDTWELQPRSSSMRNATSTPTCQRCPGTFDRSPEFWWMTRTKWYKLELPKKWCVTFSTSNNVCHFLELFGGSW